MVNHKFRNTFPMRNYSGEPPLSGITLKTLNLLAPQLTHIADFRNYFSHIRHTCSDHSSIRNTRFFKQKYASGRSFLAGLVGACPKKIASMVLKLDRKA